MVIVLKDEKRRKKGGHTYIVHSKIYGLLKKLRSKHKNYVGSEKCHHLLRRNYQQLINTRNKIKKNRMEN